MRQTRIGWIYLLASQRLILIFRKWLTEQLFPHTKNTQKWLLLIGGIGAGAILLAYPHLIGWIFPMQTATYLYTSFDEPFSRLRLLLLGGYLLLPTLFVSLSLRNNRSKYTSIWLLAASYIACCFLIFVGWWLNSIVPSVALLAYLLIAATSEELLKIINTYRLFHTSSDSILNDILPYSLLSAYGFAWLENIVYLVSHLNAWIFSDTFLSLLIWRGIFGFLLHGIFSGSIAYLLQKYLHTSTRKAVWAGFLLWIGLHVLYNALLSYNISRGIVFYLLLTYAGTTYFLYNSHRLYAPKLDI